MAATSNKQNNNSTNTRTVKTLSYRELIAPKLASDELKEELDLKVIQSKADLEVTIATTKKDLAAAKRRLDACTKAFPYSVALEMNASEEVDALQKGLDFAINVHQARF